MSEGEGSYDNFKSNNSRTSSTYGWRNNFHPLYVPSLPISPVDLYGFDKVILGILCPSFYDPQFHTRET